MALSRIFLFSPTVNAGCKAICSGLGIVCFLFIQASRALAQTDAPAPTDTHAINMLNATGAQVYTSQPQKTLEFALAALAASEQGNYARGRAEALQNLGLVAIVIGRPDTALSYLDRAVIAAEKSEDPLVMARIFHTRGIVRFHNGTTELALSDFEQALKFARTSGNQSQTSTALNQLGSTYKRINKNALALNYFKEAIILDSTARDTVRIAGDLVNLGGLLADEKKYPAANYYLQRAERLAPFLNDPKMKGNLFLRLGEVQGQMGYWEDALSRFELARLSFLKAGDDAGLSQSLGKLGESYESLGDTTRAIDFMVQSLELQRKKGDNEALTILGGKLGRLYFKRRQYDKALPLLRESVVSGAKGKQRETQLENLFTLSLTYEKLGRLNDAFPVLKWAVALQDSVVNERWAARFAEMEDKAIQLGQTLQQTDSAKKVLERNAMLSAGSSFLQNNILILSAFTAIAILVFLAFLFALGKRRASLLAESRFKSLSGVNESIAVLLDRLDGEPLPPLEKYGLAAGLQEWAVQMNQKKNLRVSVKEEEEIPRMEASLERQIYFFVKHYIEVQQLEENAKKFVVTLGRKDNLLLLALEDDGKAKMDESSIRSKPTNDWTLLLARMEQFKASWEATARPGAGMITQLRIRIRR